MSKPVIPFGWLPGHWGLKGKTKERARAEYELEGYDLEIALAVIALGVILQILFPQALVCINAEVAGNLIGLITKF